MGKKGRVGLRQQWVGHASTVQLTAIASVFGIGVWALISALDLLAPLYSEAVTVPMATLNALVGLACGGLLFKLMQSERARERQLVARLRSIAEINHHVRNALDSIELTAHVTHNRQLITEIEVGVERIQWALRELLTEEEPERLG